VSVTQQKNGFSVTAYQGDAKTLLAFNLPKPKTTNLAGFTIQYTINGDQSYYVQNELQFKDPSLHAQDPAQPATSSVNAPLHKFRWVHVPGSLNQGVKPFYGPYRYTVTPRYLDQNHSLTPLDSSLSVSVTLSVQPFGKANIDVGFTRGFVQSEAFVHHFGSKAAFRPKTKGLIFDTSTIAGKNGAGKSYTFAEEYEWLGFTARSKILDLLNEVLNDKTLRLDMFAYDLNEPDIVQTLLALAREGRIRIILDNATLHHSNKSPKPEDQFEQLFKKASKATPAPILRGKFGRYAHDKVLIISNSTGPTKVLTGSTNFSVTGMYVNSNHVLVFENSNVAAAYEKVFEDAWNDKVSVKFSGTAEAAKVFSFSSGQLPKTDITFSPHQKTFALQNLTNVVKRIDQEAKQNNGSVLFAVMGLTQGTGPILPALKTLHNNQDIFSYGISDAPGGIYLYTPRRKTGVLVTGKPAQTKLPPPFSQVPGIGAGHQIHHKFVVCGFNGKNPVVYCGSSNLTLGGEEENGDNLIAIYDGDIATVFAIEALALVDHFDFLDRYAAKAKKAPGKVDSASKQQLAKSAEWFLSTTDKWTGPYYDSDDIHSVDRELFG
jgi:phosphatidylserine/phosphatidylglycerophosphate/cardiolipin synthase-like enzyme